MTDVEPCFYGFCRYSHSWNLPVSCGQHGSRGEAPNLYSPRALTADLLALKCFWSVSAWLNRLIAPFQQKRRKKISG